MYNMSPEHDHKKQNDSGLIAGAHKTSQWPNQRIRLVGKLSLVWGELTWDHVLPECRDLCYERRILLGDMDPQSIGSLKRTVSLYDAQFERFLRAAGRLLDTVWATRWLQRIGLCTLFVLTATLHCFFPFFSYCCVGWKFFVLLALRSL